VQVVENLDLMKERGLGARRGRWNMQMCRKCGYWQNPKTLNANFYPKYSFETPGPILIRMRLEKALLLVVFEFPIVASERPQKAENQIFETPIFTKNATSPWIIF
jgi:hypothetical protein